MTPKARLRYSGVSGVSFTVRVHCPVEYANGPVVTLWSLERPLPPIKSEPHIEEVADLSRVQSQYGRLTLGSTDCKSISKCLRHSLCQAKKAGPPWAGSGRIERMAVRCSSTIM